MMDLKLIKSEIQKAIGKGYRLAYNTGSWGVNLEGETAVAYSGALCPLDCLVLDKPVVAGMGVVPDWIRHNLGYTEGEISDFVFGFDNPTLLSLQSSPAEKAGGTIRRWAEQVGYL